MTSCGRWVSLGEYAERTAFSESELQRIFESAGSVTRRVAGVDYIWMDAPESLPAKGGASAGRDSAEAGDTSSEASSFESGDSGIGREAPVSEGEAPGEYSGQESLASRTSSFEDMALQTERAISVVERSLNAFMMMHQEVVREKERAAERAGEGVPELEEELARHKEALRRLESSLQEKDQEIADLKMLVDILESRGRALLRRIRRRRWAT